MCTNGFGGESWGKQTTWKTQVYKGNIEMGLKGTERKGINWIALAKNRDKWLVFLNMTKELRIPQNVGNSLIN
jgi:hypothetical protein